MDQEQLLKKYHNFAVDLATKSGQMLMDAATKNIVVDTKLHRRDFVTQFDKSIEKFIFDSLREQFPEHLLIGEESASSTERLDSDKPTWIVDPIDGTTNFVHRSPLCCIAIGLAIKKQLVVGVINAPFLGKLYSAIKGQGAKCNQKPINVSKGGGHVEDALILSELTYGDPNEKKRKYVQHVYNELLWKSQGVRNLGSACLSLGMIAEGCADVFFHSGIHIWDMAAGYVIVTEAGGTVLGYDGQEFDPHGKAVLAAANPQLARKVAEVIRRK